MLDIILEIIKCLFAIAIVVISLYFLWLEYTFLKKGIRFFDHQEQDREYRQWQAQQKLKEDDEKNG